MRLSRYLWHILVVVTALLAAQSCERVDTTQEEPAPLSQAGENPFEADIKEFKAIKVTVKGITIDRQSQSPVLFLEDAQNKRLIPIWIGFPEARAIAIVLENATTPRPLTHDLIKRILEAADIKVRGVIISQIKDDIFYARFYITSGGKDLIIDSRPSDAIAIALRMNAPIYVAEAVFENAQTIPLESAQREETLEKTGIEVQVITEEIAAHFGVDPGKGLIVTRVRKGSPAEEAGIKVGDIILEINGIELSTASDFDEAVLKSEGLLKIKLLRDGKTLEVEVQVEGL